MKIDCCIALLLLVRPLSAMALGDEAARALDLPLHTICLAALIITVLLSAFVSAAAGMIGLAAPGLHGRPAPLPFRGS